MQESRWKAAVGYRIWAGRAIGLRRRVRADGLGLSALFTLTARAAVLGLQCLTAAGLASAAR